jgi:TolB-like protein
MGWLLKQGLLDMAESPSSASQRLRFGDFDVDLRSGQLCKRGIRIKLQDQPFQVLHVLLEHAGEMVSREELQKRIWPADTFVDFDQGLNNAIKKLRDALADDAEKPRFIETLSKRGYRFIGHIEVPANVARTAAVPAAITVDSIVVLPFINMGPDREDEFFTDGITEEIINALAQIKELHVVARRSAFSFKGKHIDPRVIREQLQVRTVLEGSVRRSGHHLRITVQLVNAVDGYHLWSERYDRETRDIFEIQDEIARSIVHRLKVIVEGGGQQRLVKVGTTNLQLGTAPLGHGNASGNLRRVGQSRPKEDRTLICIIERQHGRCGDCLLGWQVPLCVLATDHSHSHRHSWSRSGSKLGTLARFLPSRHSSTS